MKPKSKSLKATKPIAKTLKPAISAATIKKTLKKVVEKGLLSEPASSVKGLRGGRQSRNGQPEKNKPGTHPHETKNRLHIPNDHGSHQNTEDTAKQSKRQKTSLLEIPKIPTRQGTVFVIGENDVGQLGLEDEETHKRPTELPLGVHIVDIAAGGMHSVCLSANGEVYTFGCNDEGALGRPQTDDDSEKSPAVVELPENMVMICAGDSHSACLSATGKVYLWGNFRNSSGSMGLTPDGRKRTAPMRILEDVQIVKISSGAEHLVCLTTDGDVYTCGCAESGQLGRITPRSAKDGGRVKGIGSLLYPDIVRIPGRRKRFDNIWTGLYVTFMREKGSQLIYAFGLNNHNQLGYNDKKHDMVIYYPICVPAFQSNTQIICGGQHHTLSLDNLGHVYASGRKEYGRIGLGENCDDATEPTLIPALQNDNCCDVSCGDCVSFAVNENGDVYSWGMGSSYQLGHGNENDYFVPALIQGNLASWHVFRSSGGGQHTLLLAQRK